MGLLSRAPGALLLTLVLALLVSACGEASDEPEADFEVYFAPRERYAFVFPADWGHQANETRFSAHPSDGDSPSLVVTRIDFPEPTVEALVDRLTGRIPVDPTVSEPEVPGALGARRLSWRTEADLASEMVVARHAGGEYVVMLLAWDTDEPPDPDLVERILESLELSEEHSPAPAA